MFNQACEYLSYISFMKKYNLIKIFRLDDLLEIDCQDIEDSIIKAIFDCMKVSLYLKLL
jgi:hypothetical protein